MKKLRIMLIVGLILILSLASFADDSKVKIVDTAKDKGLVQIGYSGTATQKLKVMIVKGTGTYYYDLRTDGVLENFPLQMGDGEYKISVLENIGGTKYAFIKTVTMTIKLADQRAPFMHSIQNIKWNLDYNAVKKNLELIGLEKDYTKRITLAYNFMIKNVTYDYAKIPTLTPAYVPDVELTVKDLKGICYDYSALFAAMKRSEYIPVKLVKGYTTHVEGYHAWNEIYLDGKWHIVDTTVDAAYAKGKVKYTMVKKPEEYTKVYEY